MSLRAYRDISRRRSRKIRVGKVEVGGDAPISVQSMTNTITADIRGTIDQIRAMEEAGVDIARVSCPDEDATKALKTIVKAVNVPVVADIHFHYKRAIEAAEAAPRACASIPAISATPIASRKSSRQRRITASPCASASTPDRWSA